MDHEMKACTKAFASGVLGFLMAAAIALVLYFAFAGLYDEVYESGYQCGRYGTNCR